MTHANDPVLHSFAYCLDYLRDQVAGLDETRWVAQPEAAPNHPAWVVGHLTLTCQMLGGVVGLSPWLPRGWVARFASGSRPVADAGRYPTPAEALEALRDAQARMTQAVTRLTEAALDAPFPDEAYRDVFPTVRHALTQVLVGHTAHHLGQLAAWRKALGLPPLGRAFE